MPVRDAFKRKLRSKSVQPIKQQEELPFLDSSPNREKRLTKKRKNEKIKKKTRTLNSETGLLEDEIKEMKTEGCRCHRRLIFLILGIIWILAAAIILIDPDGSSDT